jgi:hypothetical protein
MFVEIYYGKSETAKKEEQYMDASTLRIGASGHQQIGDELTIEVVSQQLRELLSTFQRQAHEQGQKIIAHSALAIGTDRLL